MKNTSKKARKTRFKYTRCEWSLSLYAFRERAQKDAFPHTFPEHLKNRHRACGVIHLLMEPQMQQAATRFTASENVW